jgi:hypothetical protein
MQAKRIILFNYVDALSSHLLDELNTTFSFSHLELVDVTPPTSFGSNITYNDPNKLHYGNYNVEPAELLPLEPDFLARMSVFEIEALRMLDRGRKPGKIRSSILADSESRVPISVFLSDDLSYDERRRIYLRHVRYWHHVVRSRRIDLYISVNIPHIVYDYIAYGVCKVLGVPTIFFDRPFAPGAMFPRFSFDTPIALPLLTDNFDRPLSRFFQDFLDIQSQRTETVKAVSSGWRVYVGKREMRSVFYAGPRPSWLRNLTHGVVRSLARRSLGPLFSEFYSYLALSLHHKKWITIRRYLDAVSSDFSAVDGRRFIYFPLHYQPEASTSPLAGLFVEQLLILDMLSASLPDGVWLAVKEHPAQTAVARDPHFYADILKRPNVILLRTDVDTYALIKQSIAVATANGTAAWEAYCRGKPAIVFGLGLQGQAPAGFNVTTHEECRSAVDSILEGRYDASLPSFVNFLRRVEQAALPMYTDDRTLDGLREIGISEGSSAKLIIDYIHALPAESFSSMCYEPHYTSRLGECNIPNDFQPNFL